VAASIRRIISFPAPCRFHPGACKRRQGLTGWSSITPSSTAAAASAQSSAAFISRRSWENHPSPKPLPRQIPIGQPPLSRGFLLRGLSDAGPLTRVDRSRRAGIRNPSRKRPFRDLDRTNRFGPTSVVGGGPVNVVRGTARGGGRVMLLPDLRALAHAASPAAMRRFDRSNFPADLNACDPTHWCVIVRCGCSIARISS